jgi:hypothetical protein
MKTSSCLAFALIAFVAAPAAARTVVRDTAAIHAEQAAERAAQHRAPKARGGRIVYALGDGFGGENGPYANPYRTYPPSCMADPLPDTPTGPVWSASIDMASYLPAYDGYVREPVTISVWRVPCSSSDANHAITLMRIQRQSANDGRTDQYVVFPGVRVAQGSIAFDDANGYDLPRLAIEPNTIVSLTQVDDAMIDSTTYVLEDFPLSDRPAFDYTKAFALRFDNFVNDGKTHQYVINVPAYVPNATDYPTASEPLPISGYMTNNWYDSAHSGEGLTVQVYEQQAQGQLVVGINWFTFGPDGKPYWLTGSGVIQPGARSATLQVGYRDDGGFAGDFGSTAATHLWGTLTMQFASCNDMQFTYQSQAGLPDDVPQGGGTRTWHPVAVANGTTCE